MRYYVEAERWSSTVNFCAYCGESLVPPRDGERIQYMMEKPTKKAAIAEAKAQMNHHSPACQKKWHYTAVRVPK